MSPPPRLRLLKVIVQPVFVVDDGETLVERPSQPVAVSPEDWPTYPTTTFVAEMEQLRAQLDDADSGVDAEAAKS